MGSPSEAGGFRQLGAVILSQAVAVVFLGGGGSCLLYLGIMLLSRYLWPTACGQGIKGHQVLLVITRSLRISLEQHVLCLVLVIIPSGAAGTLLKYFVRKAAGAWGCGVTTAAGWCPGVTASTSGEALPTAA